MATMTEKMAWTAVIALANANGETELATYAEGKLAKLAEKAANRKPTATQKENEVLVAKLFAAMETGVTYTAKALGEKIGVTTPKATALAKKLDANKAEGVKGGKVKGYTALAPETEAEVETEGVEG